MAQGTPSVSASTRETIPMDEAQVKELSDRLDQAGCDVEGVVNLLWNTSSVRARFENT